MGSPTRIEDVSDTALLVASHRAEEGLRPDAIFKDPLSELLAGQRGREISNSLPYSKILSWVMVVRTSAIDRLILNAIGQGVDTVINIGAGLDTRPYRMELPRELRWIEVDFARIIDNKNKVLNVQRPVCRLERIALDLTDRTNVQSLLKNISQESKKILVITEGVIPYLTVDQTVHLAEDLATPPNVAFWIQDYYEKGGPEFLTKFWNKKFKRAPLQFKVPDWFSFFRTHGWQEKESIRMGDEARRIHRQPPFIFPWSLLFLLLSRAKRDELEKQSGFVTMEKIIPAKS
jgi:methyltransferase (TIGR00027 family)